MQNIKTCTIKKGIVWETEFPATHYGTAYTWSPKKIKELGTLDVNTLSVSKDGKIVLQGEKIDTTHTFAFQGFFKPSIGEVRDQLPPKFIGKDIYVTTQIKGDGDPSLCFTPDQQRHIGETIIFYLNTDPL